MDLTPTLTSAFDTLFAQALANQQPTAISYTLAAPKWQFLCYLTDTKNVLLHGSSRSDILEFEPRKSSDVTAFGNQRAVYAAADGIWPLFFAIVNREPYITSLLNACIREVDVNGRLAPPYYFFSVNADSLPHNPWRTGTIYILPRDTFVAQPREIFHGVTVDLCQWASTVPVRPLAYLTVEPEDFPFLDQILPHEPRAVQERATQDPDGFPWMDISEEQNG
jgi:hypothetical protein